MCYIVQCLNGMLICAKYMDLFNYVLYSAVFEWNAHLDKKLTFEAGYEVFQPCIIKKKLQ